MFRRADVPSAKFFGRRTGHARPAAERVVGAGCRVDLFAAVLGTSNYSYAQGTGSQILADWLDSRARALNTSATRHGVGQTPEHGHTCGHRYQPV